MSILIADSGSTKTDWCLLRSAVGKSPSSTQPPFMRISTQGINPVHQDEVTIQQILNEELLPQLPQDMKLSEIDFYGAGCVGIYLEKIGKILREALDISLNNIHVFSDLLAAARALCGRSEGLACILGTGSNSCLYNGVDVEMNIPPLGYILGDEGSGAVLGKMFLNALFKEDLPAALKEEFLQQEQLTYTEIIEKVYRQPLANRFLASLSRFIRTHLFVPEVRKLVVDNFQLFINKNIAKYQRPDLCLNAVGSLAFYYQDELAEACRREGIRLGVVLKAPMEGLITYHSIYL